MYKVHKPVPDFLDKIKLAFTCTHMYYITMRTPQGRPQHKEENEMTNVRESALALYDGGWRAEDEAEFKVEYDLTDDEAAELARELASIAE
nr:MAG TPA: hypothetical protein [Caudoviricetes sp.]